MEWFSQHFYTHCNIKNVRILKHVNDVPWRTALCGWYSIYPALGWGAESVALICFLQLTLWDDISEYPNHYNFGFHFFITSSSPSLSADLSNWTMEGFSLVCRYVFLLPTGYLVTFTRVPHAALVTLQTVSVFRVTNSLPRSGFPWFIMAFCSFIQCCTRWWCACITEFYLVFFPVFYPNPFNYLTEMI